MRRQNDMREPGKQLKIWGADYVQGRCKVKSGGQATFLASWAEFVLRIHLWGETPPMVRTCPANGIFLRRST